MNDLYDMYVCALLTSATAVIMPIPLCTSGKDVDMFATDTLNRGSGTVGHINLA